LMIRFSTVTTIGPIPIQNVGTPNRLSFLHPTDSGMDQKRKSSITSTE
jgi:hypothetical protein